MCKLLLARPESVKEHVENRATHCTTDQHADAVKAQQRFGVGTVEAIDGGHQQTEQSTDQNLLKMDCDFTVRSRYSAVVTLQSE